MTGSREKIEKIIENASDKLYIKNLININQTEPAQKYIDEKYPKDGLCERDSDKENKGKRREVITRLDLSKGKIGKSGNKKTLEGSLKLEGFISLEILKCSSQQITSLDVSKCPKLKRLDCDGNQITFLDVKNLTELKKINCYNNEISELYLSDNTKLKELYCQGNPLEKVVGLEKLSELTLINSGSFSPIRQLGKDTNKAKKLLVGDNGSGGYKKLMEEQVEAYKRVNDSEVFKSEETIQYQTEISNYRDQIAQIEILTNK